MTNFPFIAELKILGSKHWKGDGKSGRWSTEEHIRFLQGLKRHGKDWKLVQRHVNQDTGLDSKREENLRSGPQIRSHAQKFFKRIQPNFLMNESAIQCLNRKNYSVEILISGIEDNEEKIALISKLKDSLENFPDWDCENFITKRPSKNSISSSEKSESKSMKLTHKMAKVQLTNLDSYNDVAKFHQNNSQKFQYFPTSYKMSTVSKEPMTPG